MRLKLGFIKIKFSQNECDNWWTWEQCNYNKMLTSCWQWSSIDVGVASPPRLATACLEADIFWQYAEYRDFIVWQLFVNTCAILAGFEAHRSNSGYKVESWNSWISSAKEFDVSYNNRLVILFLNWIFCNKHIWRYLNFQIWYWRAASSRSSSIPLVCHGSSQVLL